jgi:endonuclease-3
MTKKLPRTKIPELIERLERKYPDATTALDHTNAFQLLVATILSAQTTDKRVNLVTPALFARYPDAAALAKAEPSEVEPLVHSTGFYRNKAKNIVGMARALVERYGGEVPRTMAEMLELPGVARKTANVVLGTMFGVRSGVVVDTHVARLSELLGLTTETDPMKIERDLMKVVPEEKWVEFPHLLILHGRETCVARRPACDTCVVNGICPSAFVAKGYVGERAARRAESASRSGKTGPKTTKLRKGTAGRRTAR